MLHNHIAKSSCHVGDADQRDVGHPVQLLNPARAGPSSSSRNRWRLERKDRPGPLRRLHQPFLPSRRGWPSPTRRIGTQLQSCICAVDPARYAPGSRQGNPLTFSSGRLAGVKGRAGAVPTRWSGWARPPTGTASLTLIGDGPERAALEGRARAAGLAGAGLPSAGYQAQEAVGGQPWRKRTSSCFQSFRRWGVPVVPHVRRWRRNAPWWRREIAGIPRADRRRRDRTCWLPARRRGGAGRGTRGAAG